MLVSLTVHPYHAGEDAVKFESLPDDVILAKALSVLRSIFGDQTVPEVSVHIRRNEFIDLASCGYDRFLSCFLHGFSDAVYFACTNYNALTPRMSGTTEPLLKDTPEMMTHP